MMLGTKGRYAVMAMVDLASRDASKPVTLADIAMRQDIAVSYLEQIFVKLRQAGLVRSVRGPGGGYVLARTAENTCISDIIQAAEESIKMTRCEPSSGAGCKHDRTRCVTHDLWEGLGNQIYNYLRGISLQDVLNRQVLPKPSFMAPVPAQHAYAEPLG